MAKSKNKSIPGRVCGECIHESACFYAGGGCGSLAHTDATNCVNYDTLSSYIGRFAESMGYRKNDETCRTCDHWTQDIAGCEKSNVGQCRLAKWIVNANAFCAFWEVENR